MLTLLRLPCSRPRVTEGNPLDPVRIKSAREAIDGPVSDVVGHEEFADAQDRIAFVGVSRGAIVALDAVPPEGGRSAHWSRSPACFPRSRLTPVLLVLGENDITIPPMASRPAAAQHATAGFKVELDVERGTGHTI